MEQIDKKLLLKDLCARLPYGVKVKFKVNEVIAVEEKFIYNVDGEYSYITDGKSYLTLDIIKMLSNNYLDEIKPYLFPLSSMTEEQWNNAPIVNLTDFTFESLKCGCFTLASYTCENDLHNLVEFINWLIKNHFDIYGLIPKGLAIDATDKNIY